jgi:hypothetical protein
MTTCEPPYQAVPALLGVVVLGVDPHVDHRAPGLQPAALDVLHLPARRDHDVRAPHDLLRVGRARVAHRHRGVGALEQQRGGGADDEGRTRSRVSQRLHGHTWTHTGCHQLNRVLTHSNNAT